MKRCLGEGTLRAYLDGELAAVERARAELHLESCAGCRDMRESVKANAALVSAMLDVLAADELAPARGAAWHAADGGENGLGMLDWQAKAPAPLRSITGFEGLVLTPFTAGYGRRSAAELSGELRSLRRQEYRRGRLRACATLAALAASVLLLFGLTRHRPSPAPGPVAKRAPSTEKVLVVAPVAPVVKTSVARVSRPVRPQPKLEDFMALGDTDPIQVGLVVRVMLPVSDPGLEGPQEIPADLLIGEDGRARAIRFVR